MERHVRILYKNWKGEVGYRNIIPISIDYKFSEWHKETQWIMTAFDLDKMAERGFACKDIIEWEVAEDYEVSKESEEAYRKYINKTR